MVPSLYIKNFLYIFERRVPTYIVTGQNKIPRGPEKWGNYKSKRSEFLRLHRSDYKVLIYFLDQENLTSRKKIESRGFPFL